MKTQDAASDSCFAAVVARLTPGAIVVSTLIDLCDLGHPAPPKSKPNPPVFIYTTDFFIK